MVLKVVEAAVHPSGHFKPSAPPPVQAESKLFNVMADAGCDTDIMTATVAAYNLIDPNMWVSSQLLAIRRLRIELSKFQDLRQGGADQL